MAPITRSIAREASVKADQPHLLDPVLTIDDLDCDIHPIFRPSNFSPDIPYRPIEPALRLATLLMRTQPAMSFWHTVFFSVIRPNSDCIVHDTFYAEWYEFREAYAELTAEQAYQAEAALSAFQDRVTIHLSQAEAPVPYAMCTKQANKDTDARIRISREVIAGVESAARLAAHSGDTRPFTVEMFLFAQGLVHELAHATSTAARRKGVQCFFPGAAVCEDGYELESRIFGGLIRSAGELPACAPLEVPGVSASEEGSTGFVIHQWPSPSLVARYIGHAAPIAIRLNEAPPPLPEKVGGDLREPAAFFGYAYVGKLFTQAFWDSDYTTRGARALWPVDAVTHGDLCPREGAYDLICKYREAARLKEKKAMTTFDFDGLRELRRAPSTH